MTDELSQSRHFSIIITEDDDHDLDALLNGNARSTDITAESTKLADSPEWVLPLPATPGEYLTTSTGRVPSRSILKLTSSYTSLSGLNNEGSQSSGKHFGFMKEPLSSSSTKSQDVGWDIDSSSNSQSPSPSAFLSDTCSQDERRPRADSCDGGPNTLVPLGHRRNVSFNSVNVREYDRTIGDHPSCRSGPPISLDWSYSKKSDKSLDEYELERASERASSLRKIHMNKLRRKQILSFHWGHSEEDMKKARKDTKKTQSQRHATNQLLPVFMLYEAALKAFGRGKKDKSNVVVQNVHQHGEEGFTDRTTAMPTDI